MGNYMYYKKKGPEYNKLGELHGLPKVTLRVSPMEQTGGGDDCCGRGKPHPVTVFESPSQAGREISWPACFFLKEFDGWIC